MTAADISSITRGKDVPPKGVRIFCSRPSEVGYLKETRASQLQDCRFAECPPEIWLAKGAGKQCSQLGESAAHLLPM
jgi:hypothetical protein